MTQPSGIVPPQDWANRTERTTREIITDSTTTFSIPIFRNFQAGARACHNRSLLEPVQSSIIGQPAYQAHVPLESTNVFLNRHPGIASLPCMRAANRLRYQHVRP
jgi:hypothetical protein